MEYKIYLGWKTLDANGHSSNMEDWYDDVFRKASPELYEEIVRSTEQLHLQGTADGDFCCWFLRLRCRNRCIGNRRSSWCW